MPKLSLPLDAPNSLKIATKFITLTQKLKTTAPTRAVLMSALHTAALWVGLTTD